MLNEVEVSRIPFCALIKSNARCCISRILLIQAEFKTNYFKFSSKFLYRLTVSYKINKQHIRIKIVKIADIRRRNHNRLCSFAKLSAKNHRKIIGKYWENKHTWPLM